MNIITPFGCLTNSCLVDFLKHRYHLFLLCADQTANNCSEHGTQSFRFTFHALFNKELNYVIFGLTPFIRCRYSLFHRHCLPEKHRGSKRCHWTVAGREQLKRCGRIRFQQLQKCGFSIWPDRLGRGEPLRLFRTTHWTHLPESSTPVFKDPLKLS